MDEPNTPALPPPPDDARGPSSDALGFGRPEVAQPRATLTPPPGRRGMPMGAMVTIVVVAALIAGSVAYWLVGRGDGGGLPDTLAGQPRSESEFADAMEGMMSGFDSSGVDVDVAFYGEAQIPSYMVMLMSGPGLGGAAGTDLFDAMPSGVMQAASGAEIDFSQALTEERGGVSFACVPVTSTQGGINQDLAMCLFGSDEDTVGLVMSLTGENLSAVMDATTELAESLD